MDFAAAILTAMAEGSLSAEGKRDKASDSGDSEGLDISSASIEDYDSDSDDSDDKELTANSTSGVAGRQSTANWIRKQLKDLSMPFSPRKFTAAFHQGSVPLRELVLIKNAMKIEDEKKEMPEECFQAPCGSPCTGRNWNQSLQSHHINDLSIFAYKSKSASLESFAEMHAAPLSPKRKAGDDGFHVESLSKSPRSHKSFARKPLTIIQAPVLFLHG